MYFQSPRCPLAAQFAQKCAGWFDQSQECPLAFDPSTSHLCRRYATFQNSEIARVSKKVNLRRDLETAYSNFINAGGRAKSTGNDRPKPLFAPRRDLLQNVAKSLQGRLPCSSICGNDLPRSLNEKLLALRRYVSLNDMNSFLSRGSPNARLASSFSDLERRQLRNAFKSFDDAARSSKRTHRVQSDTITWVVPDDVPETELVSTQYLRVLEAIGLPTDSASDLNDLSTWLPWISLDIASQLNAWPRSKSNTIRRNISKLSQHLDGISDALYPWNPGFSEEIAQLPIHALYQFEPGSIMRDALRTFASIGLSAINDLRCIHPTAVAHAKNTNKPLLKLFIALDFS